MVGEHDRSTLQLRRRRPIAPAVATFAGSAADNENYGRKQNRYIRPEDVEATVYPALGIDWTKQLDTPFGRTFEYVPYAADGLYLPIDELWA